MVTASTVKSAGTSLAQRVCERRFIGELNLFLTLGTYLCLFQSRPSPEAYSVDSASSNVEASRSSALNEEPCTENDEDETLVFMPATGKLGYVEGIRIIMFVFLPVGNEFAFFMKVSQRML